MLDILRKNKLVFLLFTFSLVFFIYQHSSGFSWDFAVYSLNAQYMLHNGHFMEWSRPPLASFLIGIFTEYGYIIFVSTLFLYSSLRFAKAMKINKTAYYVFAMNAAVIIFGLQVGTELLSLALLQLFVAELHTRRSGLFFGLALLTRYQNIIYLPVIFFRKNVKDVLVALAIASLLMLVWMLYNFILTGSFFSSFIDFYLLNIQFRNTEISFSLLDLLIMLGTSMPFFVYGVYARRKKLQLNDKLMIFIFAVTLVSYSLIAIKYTRFLFAAVMPAAYFASRAMERIKNKEIILWAIFVLNAVIVVSSAILFPAALNEGDYYYKLAAKDRCLGVSNAWIPVNYYGGYAEPTVSNVVAGHLIETNVSAGLLEGKRFILFRNVLEPSYYNSSLPFPVLESNELYVMYGDTCTITDERIDETFSERLNNLRKY